MRLHDMLNQNDAGFTPTQYQRFKKRYPFVVIVSGEYQKEPDNLEEIPELWGAEPGNKEEAINFIKSYRRMRVYESENGIHPAKGLILIENVDGKRNKPGGPDWPIHLQPFQKFTSCLIEAHLMFKFNINPGELS